jgi:cbb3-type cytochrome oxidase subunit 3
MSRSLSGTAFIISQILLLIIGLIFIGWLYFFLQDESRGNNQFAGRGPLTSEPASLTLEVHSPADDLLVFTPEVKITGLTQKNSQVLISSQDHDLVVKAGSSGDFSADFPLELGVNTITVAVFDDTGDARTIEKSIYYSKEKI